MDLLMTAVDLVLHVDRHLVEFATPTAFGSTRCCS